MDSHEDKPEAPVVLNNPVPVRHPGRWISAIIILGVLALVERDRLTNRAHVSWRHVNSQGPTSNSQTTGVNRRRDGPDVWELGIAELGVVEMPPWQRPANHPKHASCLVFGREDS